ncbi:flagellar hook-length control protein FliK [Anaerocolumna sp. AGMB13025]|uniref:flagellar hook-length control protein FliK n=1 Tax=Anaerocolumna sp. AGMB13025 TaxID=3039116 RepID=UPI00241EA3EF|nr:flagellar hook-length control protein FliK [Anaerocolumna sp. AGMB13025]WFR56061.1 flagellar hook-length control protein FliK [Anaerocolumna sp. AGMB13025]
MLNNRISQANTGIQQSLNSSTAASVSSGSSQTVNSTAGLEKGQIIKGEVTDLRSNEVSVKLEDGRVLTGKLEDAKNLAIGDKVVFRVEDVSLKNLTLKIISSADLKSEATTIEKALEAAGLTKNSRNNGIVQELLNQQMSIDKRTISQLIQQSILYKDTSVNTLVLMNKFHIPVNEANIRQFTAYQNSDQSLLNQFSSLSESITQLFTPEETLPFQEYLARTSDLFNFILKEPGGMIEDGAVHDLPFEKPGTSKETAGQVLTSNALKNVNPEILLKNGSPLYLTNGQTTGSLLSKEEALDLASLLRSEPRANAVLGSDFLAALTDGSADIGETAQILNGLLENDEFSANLTSSSSVQAILLAAKELSYHNNIIGASFSLRDRMKLINDLSAFLSTENITSDDKESFSLLKDRILSGTQTSKEVLSFIHANLDNAEEESVKTLLSSKEFKMLVKDALLDKWTLDPKSLGKNEDINRHFESFVNQMNDLKELINETASSGTGTLSSQVNHLNENVTFMHTLNQFFTYVQLPLKLKNQFTDGELYVYSRKKPCRTAADGISVLLHLDMEHLGPLDVYLDLQDKNLISKFYLADAGIMNLISTNIPLLTEALKAKGYVLNAEVLQREKTVNVVEDFLKADTQTPSITRYNFDLRA